MHPRGEPAASRRGGRPAGRRERRGCGTPRSGERELQPARKLRLDPDTLRRPSPLLAREQAVIGERGQALAGVYDAILNEDRDAWDEIERDVRRTFPAVDRLGLTPASDKTKVLQIRLAEGTWVPAAQVSEGLLYWLAFAALPHVSPARVLVVEEPENGLHPARIRDVVRVLRRVSEGGTQVLLATHSPLVVNELAPHEVSVVTRPRALGTQVRRLSDLPDLDRLLSVYSLGELWLAYADGQDEAGLFAPQRDAG
ncbi:MAG: AAA family ATPase [Myxococcota bacterium]